MCAHLLVVLGECGRPVRPLGGLFLRLGVLPCQLSHLLFQALDHPGWYIVWRHLVDPTETIEKGKYVIVWRVDAVLLEKADWKYEGSSASAAGGGRTHTFGVRQPAKKLRGKAVYRRAGIVVRDGKLVPADSEH